MKIFWHIVVVILLFSSCDLTETPYTIGEDNFGGSTQDAQQIVTGAYEVFWTSFMMKKTYMEWVDMDHDHACAHSWVLTGAGSGNVTTHWGYNNESDLFFAFYKIINRTNFAIEFVAKVHAISLAIVENFASFTFPLFCPITVSIFFKSIVPNIHKFIFVDVSLIKF